VPQVSELVKHYIDVCNDPDALRHLVNKAVDLFREEQRKRRDPFIEIMSRNRVIVFGDIHGDLDTELRILKRVSVEELRNGDTHLVFLGDYVDRGPNQVEVLASVLKLKLEFPENVTVLRGNHESTPDLRVAPHDFPDELIRRYGLRRGNELNLEFEKLFYIMPLTALLERSVLLLHGGLPTTTYDRATTIQEYLGGMGPTDKRIIRAEILWNDPIEREIVRAPSPRGIGYLFGRKLTRWVIKRFKIEYVIRGHEVPAEGYKINHDGRVITLVSRVGPPYFNVKATYLDLNLGRGDWLKNVRRSIKVAVEQVL